MKKILIRILLPITLITSFLFSHGGRTNSEGCHTNHSTGEYHCHGQKKKRVQSKSQYTLGSQSSSGYNCNRNYCKYMSSCEEAMYKFKVCGHYRLDGDSDGVPCENICPGG